MIFFVGVMAGNPRHVSWGLWTIFGTTALGALIAGQLCKFKIFFMTFKMLYLQFLSSQSFDESRLISLLHKLFTIHWSSKPELYDILYNIIIFIVCC